MRNLLQQHQQNNQKLTFLVPTVTKPLYGIVETLTPDKVTIVADYGGDRVRVITHPNSLVIVERV